MNDFEKITAVASDEKEMIRLFLEEQPLAGPGVIAHHLGISVNTVTKLLRPYGFPDIWTKEVVEKFLNDIVWKNAKGVTIADLKNKKSESNTPLWKAFLFYRFSAWYPLENYRHKFHRMIYDLFTMDMPKSHEEEWELEWPPQKTIRKRYLFLMRLHHPDRFHGDYKRAKMATINCQLIADAYQKLLKRKKWLTMGDPPPIQREEMAIYSKKKLD